MQLLDYCSLLFIAQWSIFGGVAKSNALLDLCNASNYSSLNLVCKTFMENDQYSQDIRVEQDYLKYALSQIGNHGSGEFDLGSFVNMLMTNFKLANLMIVVSSRYIFGNQFPVIKDLLKYSNGKIQFLWEWQLYVENLSHLTNNGFLPLEIENDNLLLEFVESQPSSFWFFNNVEIIEMMDKSYLSLDSNIYLWTKMNAYSEVKIFKAYRIETFPLEFQLWGLWNTKQTLSAPGHQLERNINLKNLTFRITAMTSSPWIYVSDENELSGFYYDLWLSLESKMGFTTIFVPPPGDEIWSGIDANGNQIGLMGLVYNGHADFVLVNMFMTPERTENYGYTIVVTDEKSKIFFKAPAATDINWSTFSDMFQKSVWISLAFVIVTMAIFLHLIYDLWETRSRLEVTMIPVTLSSILFHQGSPCEVKPKLLSGRLILIMFLFGSLVLNASFSANLTSTLSLRRIQYPFTNIKSLQSQTNYKLMIVKGTAFEHHFQESNSLTARGQLLKQNRVEFENHYKDTIRKVLTSNNNAFIGGVSDVSHHLEDHQREQLQSVDYGTEISTLFTRKNNPYIKLFNYHLRVMKENGEWDALWKKWMPKEDNFQSKEPEPVRLESLMFAFAMLIGFLSISLALLLIEIIWKTLCK